MIQRNVVLIEDDPTQNILINSLLEKEEGINQIHTFHSGEEALNFFSSKNASITIDALIVDICLPDIEGFEVIDTLNESDALGEDTFVHFISNHFNKRADELITRAENPTNFYKKPITPEKIKSMLDAQNLIS